MKSFYQLKKDFQNNNNNNNNYSKNYNKNNNNWSAYQQIYFALRKIFNLKLEHKWLI